MKNSLIELLSSSSALFFITASVCALCFGVSETCYSDMINRVSAPYGEKFIAEDQFRDVGRIKVETTEDSFLISFIFQTELGQYIPQAHVALTMKRPLAKNEDLSVILEEKKTGIYSVRISKKFVGQWDIKIVATKGEKDYSLKQRVVLHYKDG